MNKYQIKLMKDILKTVGINQYINMKQLRKGLAEWSKEPIKKFLKEKPNIIN